MYGDSPAHARRRISFCGVKIGRWQFSRAWVAIYTITGLVLIVVGAVHSDAALVVFGVVFILVGIGLDAVLHQRRRRNAREPVRWGLR
jgi:hypothetical protein